MISNYTSICIITWLGLGIMGILTCENARIPAGDKKLLYLLIGVIGAASFFEWLGFHLAGTGEVPEAALRIVYCIGYILMPLAGGVFSIVLHVGNRWRKILKTILLFNIVFQVVSSFTGWMVRIDPDHHTVTRGPLYPVYIVICMAVIALVIVHLLIYGRAFRRQNKFSLCAILVLLAVGFVMQEMDPDGHRVFFIDLTLCVAFLFIRLLEFSQLSADEDLQEKQIQIDRDELTGLLNRHAYSEALKGLDADGTLPPELAVFVIDINGLKTTNDRLGHEAGDELIIGAAKCIEEIMGMAGQCYRTGGDEYVVISESTSPEAEEMMLCLEYEARSWSGKAVKEMHLSVGCALAADHPDVSAEELIRHADLAMYAAKAEYYRKNGRDRRVLYA